MPNDAATPTKFYRLPQVREIAGGVAPSTIWGWVKNGTFPKPVKLSANCSAWPASEVEAWAQSRIDAARSAEVKNPVNSNNTVQGEA